MTPTKSAKRKFKPKSKKSKKSRGDISKVSSGEDITLYKYQQEEPEPLPSTSPVSSLDNYDFLDIESLFSDHELKDDIDMYNIDSIKTFVNNSFEHLRDIKTPITNIEKIKDICKKCDDIMNKRLYEVFPDIENKLFALKRLCNQKMKGGNSRKKTNTKHKTRKNKKI
jgi:thymidine kinase